jgi:hypothetical protein
MNGLISAFVVVASYTLAASNAVAQETPVSSFEEARSKTGCESIPYADRQRDCKELYKQQSQACDSSTQSCKDELSLNPRLYKEQLDRKIDEISKLKDSLSRDENKDKQIQIKDKIAEAEKEATQLKAQAASSEAQIKVRIGFAEKCIQARREVISKFESARNSLTNETDEAKKTLAQDIKSKIDISIRKHEDEIETRKKGIDYCNDLARGSVSP